MKRYIIKETMTAKADNPGFAGRVIISYYGKHDRYIQKPLTNWDIKNLGYTRLSDAKRSHELNHPETFTCWDVTTEVVEFEI